MNLTREVLETVLGTVGTAELALASVGGPHSVILLILAAGYTWLMSSFRTGVKQSRTPVGTGIFPVSTPGLQKFWGRFH